MTNIKTFNTSLTTSESYKVFYDFLIANKEGTFLENAEIVLEEDYSTSSKDAIYIKKDNVKVCLINDVSQTKAIVAYTNNGNVKQNLVRNSTNSNSDTCVSDALLCSNGMIVMLKLINQSSVKIPAFMLTTDSEEHLCCVLATTNTTTASYSNNNQSSLTAICSDSEAANNLYFEPAFNSPYTSLTPIVPQSNSSVTLPYAYIAPYTQLGGRDLTVVSIEGEVYITTGAWYIKATD